MPSNQPILSRSHHAYLTTMYLGMVFYPFTLIFRAHQQLERLLMNMSHILE